MYWVCYLSWALCIQCLPVQGLSCLGSVMSPSYILLWTILQLYVFGTIGRKLLINVTSNIQGTISELTICRKSHILLHSTSYNYAIGDVDEKLSILCFPISLHILIKIQKNNLTQTKRVASFKTKDVRKCIDNC